MNDAVSNNSGEAFSLRILCECGEELPTRRVELFDHATVVGVMVVRHECIPERPPVYVCGNCFHRAMFTAEHKPCPECGAMDWSKEQTERQRKDAEIAAMAPSAQEIVDILNNRGGERG